MILRAKPGGIIAFSGLVALCACLECNAENDIITVDSLLSAAQQTASRIESVQFEAVIHEDGGWTTNVSYKTNGARYRISRHDIPPIGSASTDIGFPHDAEEAKRFRSNKNRPALDVTFAYDGKRFQELNHATSLLRLSSPSEDYTQPPLILALPHVTYAWLWDAAGRNRLFSTHDEDAWRKRRSDAISISKSESRGYEVHVLTFPSLIPTTVPCTYEVGFADELGYFPLYCHRYTTKDHLLASSCVAEQITRLSRSDGLLVYPTKVRFEQTDADGSSTPMTYAIDIKPESLRLNEYIDESDFVISPSLAKHVIDNDAVRQKVKEIESLQENATSAIEKAYRPAWRSVAVVINIAIIFIIVILLWIMRR